MTSVCAEAKYRLDGWSGWRGESLASEVKVEGHSDPTTNNIFYAYTPIDLGFYMHENV